VKLLWEWKQLDTRIERGELIATGTVQPSAITRAYRMRLAYREGSSPKAFVIAPKLVRRPSEPTEPIPHTYKFNTPGEERPCLYYPTGREWTPDMPLASSIMPWLLSWLVDYEIWYATGEWVGGGMPHPSIPGEGKDDQEVA